jgi:hypothetical protein
MRTTPQNSSHAPVLSLSLSVSLHLSQIYLNGELVGGADIAIQLFQSGELAEMVEAAFAE